MAESVTPETVQPLGTCFECGADVTAIETNMAEVKEDERGFRWEYRTQRAASWTLRPCGHTIVSEGHRD